MLRSILATLVLGASLGAGACPLCLGAYQSSKAEQLVERNRVVLAVPASGGYRVVDVVKGAQPADGRIDAAAVQLKVEPDGSGRPLLLVNDTAWPMWVSIGAIGGEHARWLRTIAGGKPATAMHAQEWRDRVALALPYLESPDPLAAEIAYGELASAPYAALLTVKSRIAAPKVREWLADPSLASRRPLYLLLLGIAGDTTDAAKLDARLDAAWRAGDATHLGSAIAADLQLRGPQRVAWVDDHYLRDRKRSTLEIEAALLALSVHGNADAAIPRDRVIASYRAFIEQHQDIAGYVAQDLAAWQFWDAVPAYVAIMKSDLRQQYPSRLAIVAYLRQSPHASALGVDLAQSGSAMRSAAPVWVPPQ